MLMHSKMPESMKHSKDGMCKMCGGGMCKMADGGEVEHETQVRPDKGFGKIIQINDKDESFAEGGEAEADMPDDMANEMGSMLGEELMSAIESKDPKKLSESLEAMILNCLSKHED